MRLPSSSILGLIPYPFYKQSPPLTSLQPPDAAAQPRLNAGVGWSDCLSTHSAFQHAGLRPLVWAGDSATAMRLLVAQRLLFGNILLFWFAQSVRYTTPGRPAPGRGPHCLALGYDAAVLPPAQVTGLERSAGYGSPDLPFLRRLWTPEAAPPDICCIVLIPLSRYGAWQKQSVALVKSAPLTLGITCNHQSGFPVLSASQPHDKIDTSMNQDARLATWWVTTGVTPRSTESRQNELPPLAS